MWRIFQLFQAESKGPDTLAFQLSSLTQYSILIVEVLKGPILYPTYQIVYFIIFFSLFAIRCGDEDIGFMAIIK